jgi:aspartate-semialdehyde dehydrogenase
MNGTPEDLGFSRGNGQVEEVFMSEKVPVTILGATGSVGQRFVQLLDGHPWFEVVGLTGSDRTAGQAYGQACRWILPEPMPSWAGEMMVLPTGVGSLSGQVVFSALPADLARQVEPRLAQTGLAVFSNASAYRRESDVPILLPEVNPDHASLVETQRSRRGWRGCIVTNPNCTSTGLTVALKALQDSFGLKRVFVVSLQALSGAGYPGVAAMDILDNAIPYIDGEEEKVEWEPRKMLGTVREGQLELADFLVSAHTNRVAVSDGHLACISVEVEHFTGLEAVADALRDYRAPVVSRNLPSAPQPVIHLCVEPDRPQPRLDRMIGRGMTTVVGRLRPDPLFHFKMVVLSHNTIRGAAGGSIYNAELLLARGVIGAG